MFFFNKEEVYIGYSIEELSKVINTLNENHIKYTHKILNHSRMNNSTMMFNAGMDRRFEHQYSVSVKTNDLEKAQYLVNKALHS